MKAVSYLLLLNLLLVGILCSFASCTNKVQTAMQANELILEDAFYLVHRSNTKTSEILPLASNEKIITFNQEFLDGTDQKPTYVVVNVEEYVPLNIIEMPKAFRQDNGKSSLNLSLNESSKDDLAKFTKDHLYKTVAIVVGQKALTKHKIKSVIDGGKVQISRCTDDACEMLYVELEDNIKK